MVKVTFQLVSLHWKKVVDVVKDKKVEITLSETDGQSGVYQIYGTSPIYGMNTLLYIGKTENPIKRLEDHYVDNGHIARQPNKSRYFAEVDKSVLDTVEETLIILHKPSMNSSNIRTAVHQGIPLYIQNKGERGMLPIECTNYYLLAPEARELVTSNE